MKILLESGSSQTLSFIPREYVSLIDYTLTNESTNIDATDTNITATTVGGYLRITEVFTLIQGNFYNIDINKTDGTLIFRGRIFCTNQTIDTYAMDNGQYTEDTSKDNTYKIYRP